MGKLAKEIRDIARYKPDYENIGVTSHMMHFQRMPPPVLDTGRPCPSSHFSSLCGVLMRHLWCQGIMPPAEAPKDARARG